MPRPLHTHTHTHTRGHTHNHNHKQARHFIVEGRARGWAGVWVPGCRIAGLLNCWTVAGFVHRPWAWARATLGTWHKLKRR